MQVRMWETITQAEIDEAKAWLSRKREAMLSRHAAEIKGLDAQLVDVESFEQVVAAFFEEHMYPERPTAPAASDPEQAMTASLPEQGSLSTQAPQKAPCMTLQIRQNILPKFVYLRSARRLIGSPSQVSRAIPKL
jgi:hypothetical protein